MAETPSLSRLLSQQDQLDSLDHRIKALEEALLLLARHVGAVGWNYQLQQALDRVREAQR